MLNLLKLVRWSICLLLGMAVSCGVVSVSAQSAKTGGDNFQDSVWVNNSILEEAPYVNAEKVETVGLKKQKLLTMFHSTFIILNILPNLEL